jgi:D-sedoheptulose 7-phosphate isomerase
MNPEMRSVQNAVTSPVREHLLRSAEVKQRAAEVCEEPILEAAGMVAECFRGNGRLLLCGNGGSAADCQHIAAEFVSTLTQSFLRPALGAIALTTDTSFLTASANDFGFENIFARQVEALGRPGDVLIGISTSGGSANVVRALAKARELGLRTVALTGERGGAVAEAADVAVKVPSDSTQHIQETHIAVGHILCDLVERSLFNR